MWELQGERLIGAAGALGYADYLLEKWDELIREDPVRSLTKATEEIEHLKANVYTAKLFNYGLVKKFMDGKYDTQLVSIAKYYCSRLAYKVAERLLLLSGPLGVKKDNVFERIWRDSRVYRIGGGTDEIMLEVIAKDLNLA